MSTSIAEAWASVKTVPNIVGILVGFVGVLSAALITAIVNLHNSRKSLKHAKDTLDVQRTANARSAATFIADKRQKWIEDLRADVSLYLALSVELTEAWKRTFSNLGDMWDRNPYKDNHVLEDLDAKRVEFLSCIAARDSEHYQLLTRILLRLNNEELPHQGLLAALFKLRSLLADLQMRAVRVEYANQDKFMVIEHELQFAAVYAKVILKEEWQKLKREVADPVQLIDDILATSKPDDDAVEALVRKTAPSVPSPLSTNAPAPDKFPV
ncbi:conserved protein of unknown function [Burkholderia multivorans]